MSSPLMDDVAGGAWHDKPLRAARRIRAQRDAERAAGEHTRRAQAPFEDRLARALALLMAVIVPH
ncbi:MAG TPA: hypothetical protein VNL77_02555 [Roseiflexaceae bacterium]|nr:hypothetical protein [Roseiflexaceae bacterium]